jgi:hypothetical protein
MNKVRALVIDWMDEYGFDNRTALPKRRELVTSLLAHFPATGRRNARAILDRTLAHPEERRGGKRKGAGALAGNQNAASKK